MGGKLKPLIIYANKYPFSLNEATRKQILERYVARYINHVTTQKEASNGGNACSNSLVVGTSGSAAALHSSGNIIDSKHRNFFIDLFSKLSLEIILHQFIFQLTKESRLSEL